ncbi:16267_t:CDS:2, partial [Dentiscutata erythropus]
TIFNPTESTEEIFIKEILIKINDDFPVAYDKLGEKFTLDSTLNDVRRQLSDENEIICIQDNMYFCSPSSIILRDSESNKLLKDVLSKDNILQIRKLPNVNKKNVILKNCKLEYGINMTDEGPKIANEVALEFSQNIMDEPHFGKVDKETYENSFEDFLRKNLIADVKASVNFLHLSIGLGMAHECSSTNINNTKFFSTHEITLLQKYSFKIGNIKPTEKFKKEVEDALNSHEPKAFKNICEKYGEFIARKVKIANGKLGSEIVGGINFEYSKNQGINISSSISSVTTYTRVYGGDKSKFHQGNIDFDFWLNSLNDYERLCAIEYEDLIPMFDLLDPELHQKVIKKTINEKIIYSTKDPVEFTMLPHEYSYYHKLKIPTDLMPNLKEYKIFVSVMSTKKQGDKTKKQGDEISTRVVYTSDYSSATLALHRLSESKGAQIFSLQIGWIIIGHPKSFKYECHDFHVTHSCEVKCWENSIGNYDQFDNIQGHSLLATCAQRIPQQSEVIPMNSKLVTELSDLIIHCGIIRSESCSNDLKLNKKKGFSFSKKSYICYDISGSQNTPLWTHDKLTFVNILQNACPDSCTAGFIILSPTPKYLVFNQNVPKDLQISYFCIAPLN